MKKILIVISFLISSLGFAGGSTGGGTPPSIALIDGTFDPFIIDRVGSLGLKPVPVKNIDYRRTAARLSYLDEVPLKVGTQNLRVTKLGSGILGDADLAAALIPDLTTQE
ncbi:MAG: hypothetical protein ACOVS5_11825 [Oligoflexus sp.]|jgi:hypothetical protein